MHELCQVKLIVAEDLRPQYNTQRGGCNIDAAFVVPRGWLLELPPGVHLV
jgi:hypothetical protein